jgi:hypothetical protein
MPFTKYHFTRTHVIIRKLKHLKYNVNYIISVINHIFGSEYHTLSLSLSLSLYIYIYIYIYIYKFHLYNKQYAQFCFMKILE